MKTYPTLQSLLENDPRSRQLFHSLPRDVRVAIEEQQQHTGDYESLRRLADSFARRDEKR